MASQVSNSQVLLMMMTCLGVLFMYLVTEFDVKVDRVDGLTMDSYAVFGCSTPGEKNHRGYDYAFYLPLAVLAWQRIGFKSVVLIIGTRIEWERSRPLSWVLYNLDARGATVIFIDAMNDNRPLLGQIARIFTVNFASFPGKADDFLITSDADLWPLHKGHFVHRPGMQMVLVHGKCCGPFRFNDSVYHMYPMSNIGATVATWRQVINEGSRPANDSASILQYMEHYFGSDVWRKTPYAKDNWFLDQKLVSIRIKRWIDKYGNGTVYVVPDAGYSRVDRPKWKPTVDLCVANRSVFDRMYDAHLPNYPNAVVWTLMQPLLTLMFGNGSWQCDWADNYALGFFRRMNESLLY